MTDSDVQDVRDHFVAERDAEQHHQTLLLQMKRLANMPTMTKEDLELQERLRALSAKYEQKNRLGLNSNAGPSKTTRK
ncbi:hypothetical protein CC1G_14249 [Coprinopsis cinerea okayama7|uniref:Uncharacterized protein n=1 Tax=Coprinopsis cinerea (strain Okayama-7 / 130 / ATCC MYA-4618 / FGSC 9003) TaxID=240176 RepID=D6RLQ6_COPC7|nr:hypothetical protein CC1G_14249 [Coprinopsis cinerea okayama7\|eukprot:XP_002911718.1 hypothetical protein CC1G_14249 [Coprinopsis cinerea okayama7\